MKKIFLMFMCAIAVMTTYACTNNGTETTNIETVTESNSTIDAPKQKQAKVVKILDFSATWCGPCNYMKPIVAELEKEYKGKVEIKTVDIDKNPKLTEQYMIDAVPTFIFLDKNGKEIYRFSGSCEKSELKQIINQFR